MASNVLTLLRDVIVLLIVVTAPMKELHAVRNHIFIEFSSVRHLRKLDIIFHSLNIDSTCTIDEFRCATVDQCIRKEYICDHGNSASRNMFNNGINKINVFLFKITIAAMALTKGTAVSFFSSFFFLQKINIDHCDKLIFKRLCCLFFNTVYMCKQTVH